MLLIVDPCYLIHPVNFPLGRKLKCPEKTHDFQQRVDLYTQGLGSSHIQKPVPEIDPTNLEVKGRLFNHFNAVLSLKTKKTGKLQFNYCSGNVFLTYGIQRTHMCHNYSIFITHLLEICCKSM